MPIVQLSASPSDLPFGFGSGSRSSTSTMAAANSIRGRVSPAKRRLNFGDDDHDDESVRQQNLRRLHSQVDQLIQQQKLRWNFDFIGERPLPGNFTWQPVATSLHLNNNNNNNNQGLKRSLMADCNQTLDDNRKMARTDVHIWDVHNNNNRNTTVRHLQGQTKITGKTTETLRRRISDMQMRMEVCSYLVTDAVSYRPTHARGRSDGPPEIAS